MPVAFDIRGPVALLTLNRPLAMNALDVDSLSELRAHLLRCQDNVAVRCVVLAGAGERAFCTGADLKGAPAGASYAQGMFGSKDASDRNGLYVRLMDLNDLRLTKPVVAAIEGYCLGGGLELALQCDIRIASRNASFGLPEVCVGSIPGVLGVTRLMRAVGSSHAMQMALTGDRVAAAQAQAMGLVSEVLEARDLMDRAFAIAERIAANGPLAVQAVKRLAHATVHLSETEAQDLTELHWGALRDTQDRVEGRAAFAQKRAPNFTGR
ncbi:enoyl-CoA hydratase/isomerase family protein [Variovorax saccharolyticus]|uniref:enoyl-CoA hydratase/isomerase family protein n=1 Tax=Variovorax saccharolyticus TaxID=3053516 RepID=UPI002576032D|nr:enoyl-CoA hydratase/isomerase family protein [Variovorax sp. J22R187]MDM0021855.1 enoyl-CoA hydratase/isomerase family protein [Variovorax sp. J22R187]